MIKKEWGTKKMNEIYIVLGMHKSGTTLISQTLHHSGINMGRFNKIESYDDGNKYERKETKIISHELLNSFSKHSLYTNNFIHSNHVKNSTEEKIKSLILYLNTKYYSWGFKDFRTCLTYSIWRKYLPKNKLIIVHRHPLEVWLHYQKSFPSRKFYQKINAGLKSLNTWYVYNSSLNNIIQHILRTGKKFEFFSPA